MKKKTKTVIAICIFLQTLFIQIQIVEAQSTSYTGAIGDQDWTRMWTQYKPNDINYYATSDVIPGIIDKNTTLTKDNTYLLQGVVYVINNATLTIEAGTVIKGDYATSGALVITKGSKIIANGTEMSPIIFTSNKSVGEKKPGDWGGIIILGDAEVNKIGGVGMIEWGLETKYAMYGGTNNADNSGSLKYVRIEYPGKKLSKDQELNGLTLAGVGKSTMIENVQISYSNDDSYEMFGGTVSLKNVLSYRCTDDDFDFNFGYNGTVQSAIAIRHPLITDYSGSRCVEADSYSGAISSMDPTKKFTNISFYNLTFVAVDANNPDAVIPTEAIYSGKDCNISLHNSIVSGFKIVFLSKDDNLKAKAERNGVVISNNLFNRCTTVISVEVNASDVNYYFSSKTFGNRLTNYAVTDLFNNPLNKNYPDFSIKMKELFSAK